MKSYRDTATTAHNERKFVGISQSLTLFPLRQQPSVGDNKLDVIHYHTGYDELGLIGGLTIGQGELVPFVRYTA